MTTHTPITEEELDNWSNCDPCDLRTDEKDGLIAEIRRLRAENWELRKVLPTWLQHPNSKLRSPDNPHE